MGFRTFITDMRETRRNLAELLAENTAEERAASLQIARSASRFSRRTRKVVDDKLTFSATLMRAGEVTAATRLLAEVEEEVRNEEVAMLETVNEVKVAQAVRRGRITRLRLARSLAVAMLGACLLAFSAVGMAVAGVFQDRLQRTSLAPLRTGREGSAVERSDARRVSPGVQRLIRRLQIGDVKLVLTAGEYRKLNELTGGDVDSEGLEDVIGMLTGALAEKVEQAIAVASEAVEETTSTLAVEEAPIVRRVERAKKKTDKPADEKAEEPADEPSPDPDPEPDPDPDPEPEPEPSPTDEGDGGSPSGGGGSTPLPLGDGF